MKDYDYISMSPYFDKQWYKRQYLLDDETDPVEHYLNEGWLLGYDASIHFSTTGYQEMNADVLEADINPLLHFELYGRKEKRTPIPIRDVVKNQYNGPLKTKAYYTPESAMNRRKDITSFIDSLMKYDIISFDIFDTLVLRNVQNPTDVFRIMGCILKIEKFCQLRIKAENEARRDGAAQKVNIYDIYDVLGKYIMINNRDYMVNLEMEIEKKVCVANPYMKEVYEQLQKAGKIIIINSDMYIPHDLMAELLQCCGYHNYNGLYVSCDYIMEKASGELQLESIKNFDNNPNCIHIGDNKNSDYYGSIAIGWDAFWYEKCMDLSQKVRSDELNTLVQSFYHGIVSNHLYNGKYKYSKEYEHGFIYGGIIVTGFCEYINAFCTEHNIEMIWMMARDMDIVFKVYKEFYNQYPCEYIAASRSAALELTFQNDTENFIEFYFKARADAGNTMVADALKETDMELLLPYLKEYELNADDMLTQSNYENIRKLIYGKKEIIIDYFSRSVDGAYQYLSSKLNNAQNICMVDIGWSGTIFTQFRQFFRNKYKDSIKLSGLLLGAANVKYVNDLISDGFLDSYIFSATKNSDKRLRAEILEGNTQIMLMESMFSSNDATLLKYDMDSNKPKLIYGHKTNINDEIVEIQTGILDFCKIYKKATQGFENLLKITGEDAFAPYQQILRDYNYFYLMFSDVKEYQDGFPRITGGRKMTTIGNILKQRGLV